MGVLKLVPGISPARLAHLATIDVGSLPGDYYPYEYWVEEGFPISGPAASPFGPGPDKIDTDVVHYAAAYYKNGSDNVDMVQKLRAENRDYWLNRNPGYALGYNHQMDRKGNIWECRGWRIRNAANSTTAPNFNVRSMSMHIVVSKLNSIPTDSQAEQANAAQIASMKWYRKEQKRRAGFELALLGHRDTKPTGCPGSGIYFQIWNTNDFAIPVVIEPKPEPPIIVVPPSTGKRKKMDFIVDYGVPIVNGWWTRCGIAGGNIFWIQGKANEWTDPITGATGKLDNFGIDHIQVENDQHFHDLLATYHATSDCPVTFVGNQGLLDAWNNSRNRD